MKVNLNEVPVSGLLLEETKTGKLLDVERTDIAFNSPVHIRASIKRENNQVQIELNISTQMQFVCARCLEEGQKLIKKDISIIRPIDKDSVVDLTQIAREEIILDYPLKLLCREDCKGLCPRCGKNLNVNSCDCKTKSKSSSSHINLNL